MWSKCANLATEVSKSSSTVLDGMLYFGGGVGTKESEHDVHCYNIVQDEWSLLPKVNVRRFSLGHIEGRLVSIGGVKKHPSKEQTDEVFTFIESNGKWKKAYPPMPTARSSAVVFSLEQALIVACGNIQTKKGGRVPTNSIEVFKHSDSQWYTCRPHAQVPISTIVGASGVLIGPNMYMMGGITIGVNHSQVVCASVDDILRQCHATPVDQESQRGNTDTNEERSLWRRLPDTPTNKSAITTLNGSVIALGGEGGLDTSSSPMHMYSPSTDLWINIGELPSPRLLTTVSALSRNEIIFIGGFDGTKEVNTVYKGTLQLTL